MDEFPSNSHTKKGAPEKDAPKKKIERVTTADPIRRKQSLSKRFSETFVQGDARSVWGYVMFDVLLPAAKDMVSDAVSSGIDRMLFGESRSPRARAGRSTGSPIGHIAYNRMAQAGAVRPEPRTSLSRRSRASHDFDELVLATRAEAEEVIDRLFDLVSKYDSATVADLYELTGVTGSYTDDKWGWTDLRGAGVSRTKGGYLLDLPRPEPLD